MHERLAPGAAAPPRRRRPAGGRGRPGRARTRSCRCRSRRRSARRGRGCPSARRARRCARRQQVVEQRAEPANRVAASPMRGAQQRHAARVGVVDQLRRRLEAAGDRARTGCRGEDAAQRSPSARRRRGSRGSGPRSRRRPARGRRCRYASKPASARPVFWVCGIGDPCGRARLAPASSSSVEPARDSASSRSTRRDGDAGGRVDAVI